MVRGSKQVSMCEMRRRKQIHEHARQYARQRMGPKLMNCCRPGQVDTKEFWKMVKRIQILEEGRVPAKEAKNWRIDGEKKRITRKAYKRLLHNFEMEGLMEQKGLWNLAKEKTMKERGELPNEEEGDVVREYEAMHEEDFWSSWLYEDEKSKEERKAEVEGKGEEEGEKRKREEEKEENETGTVKRRCEGFVSVGAFDILSQG